MIFIGLIQSAFFIYIVSNFYSQNDISFTNPLYLTYFSFVIIICSSLLGLFVSSMARDSEQVMSAIPIILIPQILLAGFLDRISTVWIELISYVTISRWSIEALTFIQNEVRVESSGTYEFTSQTSPISSHEILSSNFYWDPTMNNGLGLSGLSFIFVVMVLFMIFLFAATAYNIYSRYQ